MGRLPVTKTDLLVAAIAVLGLCGQAWGHAPATHDCSLCDSLDPFDADKYACGDARADACQPGWHCDAPWTDLGGGAWRCPGYAHSSGLTYRRCAPASCYADPPDPPDPPTNSGGSGTPPSGTGAAPRPGSVPAGDPPHNGGPLWLIFKRG